MIIVTCQYVDENGIASYNGGWSIQLYSITEATLFAIDSSRKVASNTERSITRVYNDGIRIAQYMDGQPYS